VDATGRWWLEQKRAEHWKRVRGQSVAAHLALAEVDPTFQEKQVQLVYKRDGCISAA
jgi:hypothetical protein